MRNRRLIRIRPGGMRMTYQPFWPKNPTTPHGWLHTALFGARAAEVRP